MNLRSWQRRSIILLAPFLVGCAVGNRHVYHTVLVEPSVSGSGQIGVATHDQRPYVLSGDKEPQFVGLQRGGFGNPFDVRTAEGRPLAEDMTQAVADFTKGKGLPAGPEAEAWATQHASQIEARRRVTIPRWEAKPNKPVPRASDGR